jgi:transglutaminase-like putative cysteine protease
VVGVSALLFLAIPRFQLENSLFLERFLTKKARTGFSDNIKFGDVTDIQQDDGVAASVDVPDPALIPAEPYWRMVVLDDYREQAFRLSPQARREYFSNERADVRLRGVARARAGEPVYWTFYLEAGVSRYMPLLGAFELLEFRERQNFRFSDRLALVALRDEPVSMTAYRVLGLNFPKVVPDPGLENRLNRTNENGTTEALPVLRLGLGDEDRARLARVVQEITGGERLGAAEFAERTGAWLAARHGYSLQSRVPGGAGDPLVRWLESREPGHCELFAGAFVLLARAAGHPARIVTGFRGGSWNAYSNNFTLRHSDAHAWCEIYDITAQGWRRTDPTPGATGLTAADPGQEAAVRTQRIDRSWSARLDSLRVFWYRRIVNFDQRTQEETLKAVKTATQESGRRVRETLDRTVARLKAWLLAPWDVQRVIGWLGGAAAVAGAAWAVRNARFTRFDWRFWQRRGAADPVRAEAGRWLVRLEDRPVEPVLRATLQRLRYGPAAGRPEVGAVFRHARQAFKSTKRSGPVR